MKKTLLLLLAIFITFICFQYFYARNSKSVKSPNSFDIVAHRGVHQNYHKKDMNWKTTCTAKRIYTPTHKYLENTIESSQAAFDLGATIVEIDINRTSDDHIVLFHDWMLECRTEAKGKISDFPLDYLKTLDIGYGYTFDDGKTFPFRGKGVGKMPTFMEVLKKFPDKKFFIDHKDGSKKTAELLVEVIKSIPTDQQDRFYYWGRENTFKYINAEIPKVKRLFCNRRQMKKWLIRYLLTFGLSGFPVESQGYVLAMPPKYLNILWGWPYRFLNKVHNAGAKFYLMIDTEEDAKKYVDFPVDGIVTDYIEVVAPHFRK